MSSCALYNYVCWGWLGTALCSVGFVLSCLVLYSFYPNKSSPTSHASRLILRTLALVDAVLLVSVLVTDCVPYICSYTGTCRSPWKVWPYVRYVWCCTPTAHLAGVWLVVLIAANRYTAVCHPHRMEKLWSQARTAIAVLVTLIIATAYNVPRLLEYTVVSEVNPCLDNATLLMERANPFADRRWYRVGYKAALTSAVLIAGPLVLQTVLTLAAVRRLTEKRSVSGAASTSRGAKRVGGTTRVLMSVVGVAIACQLPLGAYQIARALSKTTDSCDTALYWLDTMSKLAVNANPTLNFVVYFSMSPPFRKSLRALWYGLDGCGWCAGWCVRRTAYATTEAAEVGVSEMGPSKLARCKSNDSRIGQPIDSDGSSSTCFSCSK